MRVVPWITDGAREFIDGFLHERKRGRTTTTVFEFGSGSSTLYFLSRGCRVVSVEHNPEWHSRVQVAAEAFGWANRLEAILSERPYDNAIGERQCDVLFVDGRDRVRCVETNLPRVRPDGLVVIDNTERLRGRYRAMLDLMTDLDCVHFEQPAHRGHGEVINYRDHAGTIVSHRWITTCAWWKQGQPRTTQGARLLPDATPDQGEVAEDNDARPEAPR